MPSKIILSASGQPEGKINLPETMISDDFSEGSEVQIVATNISESTIRRLSIGLEGKGSEHVVLAVNAPFESKPGVWAAPGEGIIAFNGKLPPEGKVAFWAKGVYQEDSDEGTLPFEFVVETISGS